MPVATRHATVRHAEGLHARPAELVARLANKYESAITLTHGSLQVDAKSILDVLTLGAERGVRIAIDAVGSDAEQAVQELCKLLESDFVASPAKEDNDVESG